MALQKLEKWQSLPICLAVVAEHDSALFVNMPCSLPCMCNEDYELITAAAAVSA